MDEKLLIERSSKGRKSYSLPQWDDGMQASSDLLPKKYLRRDSAHLPEVSELEIVRHFTRLSQQNFSIDTHFYPLGSCTMKYNPKCNEAIAALPGFAHIHPLQPEESVQGILELLYRMERSLSALCGMDEFTLQPAAGAHGELAGLYLIKAYHKKRGDDAVRTQVIVPDACHGTNPSSAHLAGYEVITIPSDKKGRVDIIKLKEALSEKTAAFMLTNPNTLGVFEKNILEVARAVHKAGALLYYDGANLNPLLGICRPGDMGFDVVHVNVHKTFSTPHGGGGPGAGPVGVKERLRPFLPHNQVVKRGTTYSFKENNCDSIGKMTAFYGNIGILVRGYTYILINGIDGLRRVGETAILNSNYLYHCLKDSYCVPYNEGIMHEFVISMKEEARVHKVRALDVAKALIDSGIHPPTIYFPLIVSEALMIEPTETETREVLDVFVEHLLRIKSLMASNPEIFHSFPAKTTVNRPDEVTAARKPVLTWQMAQEG